MAQSGKTLPNSLAVGLVALGLLKKAGKLRPKKKPAPASEAASPAVNEAVATEAASEPVSATTEATMAEDAKPEPAVAPAGEAEGTTPSSEAASPSPQIQTAALPSQTALISQEQAAIIVTLAAAILADPKFAQLTVARPWADPPAPVPSPEPTVMPAPAPEPAAAAAPTQPATPAQPTSSNRSDPVTSPARAVIFAALFFVYLIFEAVASMLVYMYLNLRHIETFGYLVGLCRGLLTRFAAELDKLMPPDIASQANASLLGEIAPKSVLLLFIGLTVSALLRLITWIFHQLFDSTRS
jgi:hypothetical protein